MNNGVNISYRKHQTAQASGAMIAGINTQIGQTAQLDEQPGLDSAPGVGNVRAEDTDSFVQLSYDPQTNVANSFQFQARNDIKAPNGQVVVPGGLETSMDRADNGVETYSQRLLGGEAQQVVVDPQSQTINLNGESITFQENQISQTASAIVATVNGQIANSAALDEQPGLDSAPGVGSVKADDEFSSLQLSYDPQTRAAKSFSFEAHQDIKADNGAVVISKGAKTSMTISEDGVETYSQTIPMQDGRAFQQDVSVNEKAETISYNEWILNA
jgi:hypothetical protein